MICYLETSEETTTKPAIIATTIAHPDTITQGIFFDMSFWYSEQLLNARLTENKKHCGRTLRAFE